MNKMKHFRTLSLFFALLSQMFLCSEYLKEANAPGDIIIGGLFPIHESVGPGNDKKHLICNRFSVARLAQSLMMVHAIEEVNQSGELGCITLGYDIRDSCGDVTTALKNTLSFMRGNNGKKSPPPVMAVIGDYYSEISMAVTRLLNLESIPEISYGATSGLLSDKTRFPSFLRTVPEDEHQTHAIAEILKNHEWNWVGLVATDGEYGRYAVERLQRHATKHNICFAFTCFLPELLADKNLEVRVEDTVRKIIENENVSVIVSFAKPNHMMDIFDKLLTDHRGRNKVWLASDSWSQSLDVLDTTKWKLKDVGTIFGTTLKSGNTSKFEQFLRNLDMNFDQNIHNSFLMDFFNNNTDTLNTTDKSRKTAIEKLIKMTFPYAIFSIELAVKAISQAVKDLCINKMCDISRLQPSEFRDALQKATFSLDGKTYSFDEHGNVNSGYDVVLWKCSSPSVLDINYIVGHYDIGSHELRFSPKGEELFNQTRKVSSRCSRDCAPGEMKISNNGHSVCCYECKKCPENHFSNTTDSTECTKCDTDTEYSDEGSSECFKRTDEFLKWEDPYHKVILAFTALGVLLTLVVGIIFLTHWNTPVVRSSVGPISILLLLSLLLTFGSVFLFGARPKDWKCKARQVVFGLSFTLSVSCILAKSFKIILAFELNPKTLNILKKLNKPYLIITSCMAGQVVICASWLSFKPPKEHWKLLEKQQRLWYCDEELPAAFGAMLAYIGFLALICFVIAFKGRKLPKCYNDAKFITFSMLIYIITWIIFGPVYVTVTGKYLPAVEMVVILFSSYSILFCLFFTKCYIILFKREENTVVTFCKDIRNYTAGKDMDEEGKWSPFSSNSYGIQNPTFSMGSVSDPESSDPLTDRQLPFNSTGRALSPVPASNTLLHNNLTKKQLQRCSSLPAWLPK